MKEFCAPNEFFVEGLVLPLMESLSLWFMFTYLLLQHPYFDPKHNFKMGCSGSKPASKSKQVAATKPAKKEPAHPEQKVKKEKEEKRHPNEEVSLPDSHLETKNEDYCCNEQIPDQCTEPIENLHKFTVKKYFSAKLPSNDSVGLEIDFSEGNPNYIDPSCIEKSNGLLKSQRAKMGKIYGFNILNRKASKDESEEDAAPLVVTVRVEGADTQIPTKHIVPGDIVKIDDKTPLKFDLRLLEANDMRVQTAVLTGEPESLSRNASVSKRGVNSMGQDNVILYGMELVCGTGWGQVYATGFQTQIGYMCTRMDMYPA
eukprot:TRINITY_DN516_c0_g1_i8.p1 TRINITY_DN516_c0_g1~~TRINITY_DN516_c0_g1_i8.p1  ORF type:complete len:315 (+),score=56.69 TRINITY_DN516_c0_g1_i8:758-1702(+)